jgi:hypothetical protein
MKTLELTEVHELRIQLFQVEDIPEEQQVFPGIEELSVPNRFESVPCNVKEKSVHIPFDRPIRLQA